MEIRGVVADVLAALAELRANAEAARVTAAQLRDAALAASSNSSLVLAAYETLVATIDQVEATKAVAFETELVAGDTVLEATETELAAIGDLASRSSDEDFVGVAASLTVRLDTLFEKLSRFPIGPVEESTLSVVPADGSLGTVLSQLVRPGDVAVLLPRSRRVMPGSRVAVELALPYSGSLGADGANHAARALLKRTVARASLILPGGTRMPVASSVSPVLSSDRRCGVTVSFAVPADAPLGSSFVIDSVMVAQKPAGTSESARLLPCALTIVDRLGICAPFTLRRIARDYQLPCIGMDGRIFIADGSVRVYDEHGELLETLRIAGLKSARTLSYVESTGVLLVRDGDYTGTDIIAMDITSSARPPPVLWIHTIPTKLHKRPQLGPGGLVVLPELGVAVYAAYFANGEVAVPACTG